MKQVIKGFIFFIIFFFAGSTSVFASDILLDEIFPNPPSGEKEWVEIYNSSTSSVDLSNFYLDDDDILLVDGQIQKGTSDPGSDPFKLEGVLGSKLTCFITFSSYLNNDKDKPTVFLSDGSISDSYEYIDSSQNKSFARVPDGGDWQVNQNPTKPSLECSSLVLVSTSTPTPTHTPTPTLKPTSTPKPTPTPTKSPTSKPILTSTPVLTEKKTSVISLTSSKDQSSKYVETKSSSDSSKKYPNFVLGEKSSPSAAEKETKVLSTSQNNLSKVLIGIGALFLIACGILAFRSFRKMKNED